MAFDIQSARRPADGGFYVSPVRISLTVDDELCDPESEEAAFLLVGKGGSLPTEVAERYGLVGEPGSHPKKPGNKSRKGLEDKDGATDDGDDPVVTSLAAGDWTPDTLETLTVAQLAELAAHEGLSVASKAKKAELIFALIESRGDPAGDVEVLPQHEDEDMTFVLDED